MGSTARSNCRGLSGRRRCSGLPERREAKQVRGKEGYGAQGSEARANWGSLVLQRARHGGVAVAAARSFGGGVAKGGGTSARGAVVPGACEGAT